MSDHKRGRERLRVFLLVLADIVIINATNILAVLVRMEFNLTNFYESPYLQNILYCAVFNTALSLLFFKFFNIYKILWRYAGITEAFILVGGCALSTSLQYILMQTVLPRILGNNELALPRSYPIIAFLLLALAEGVFRFSYRLRDMARTSYGIRPKADSRARTMLIGAGRAGALLLRDLANNPATSHNNVVCIIDDDRSKLGHYLNNIPIVGGKEKIREAVGKYNVEEIIIALPSASAQERRAVIDACGEVNCRLRTVPALYQLAGGDVSAAQLRDVKIDDLLGRDSVNVNVEQIMGYVSGKTVLVTGGGGSIGSELCRQIARHKPKKLIIFDIYENNAYALQQELLSAHPELELEVLIGSVRDKERVDGIFGTFRPEVVYHAAAHKHVPLMEDSPNEAVKNNVFGTRNVADAAHRFASSVFVFISTDKAVNPTNIMGATKRLCEMVIEYYSRISQTKFVAVRFGNVLGSNGSVIPLFRRQI
ncbi:MAG: polysaccharide biosynthesis protein, partial [Clostridia bacterium]|nr:polysaccharide biosynthesis protein [Clostridia bacterium]